jgi:hypothetical protein
LPARRPAAARRPSATCSNDYAIELRDGDAARRGGSGNGDVGSVDAAAREAVLKALV